MNDRDRDEEKAGREWDASGVSAYGLAKLRRTPRGYHLHLGNLVKLTDACPFCGKPNKAYNA